VAAFVISPTDPLVGDTVAVDASASTVPVGRSIVGYSWNFGNGQTGSGRTATVMYDRASTYTIVLTVTDDTGRTGVTSRTVQVK
jgi:chitinase